MITKATKKQWDDIDRLRQSIISGITNQPSDEAVRDVVRGTWKDLGAEPKAVLIADCPISAVILAVTLRDQLRDQLRYQLCDQLHDQLCDQLSDQLYGQLYDQLRGQLSRQLRDQLHDQLSRQLRDQLSGQLHGQLHDQLHGQLRSQLHDQLRGQLSRQLSRQLSGQLYAQLYDQLHDQLRGQLYVSLWWRSWSGWYEGGKLLGAKFDEKLLDKLLRWTNCVPAILATTNFPIVSRWPTEVLWKNGLLHNESGQSVTFRSGWGLWTIDGTPVDEQIVMKPETQTIEQIDKEENQDVRSIRIQRFGWPRYINESGAKAVDSRKNEIEGTMEALFLCKDGSQRLVVTCPTARIFALGVPGEVKTCEQAQAWLAGGKKIRILART